MAEKHLLKRICSRCFIIQPAFGVYDIQGDKDRYGEFQRKAFGRLDLSKYDFVLFLALGAKNEGLSCGGG